MAWFESRIRSNLSGASTTLVTTLKFDIRVFAIFDHPRTRVVGPWLGHSRRQKSRNLESHRAGKRSRVEFRSAAEGLFLPSHVVTPVMRDWRPRTILLLFLGEPTWFRRISEDALWFHKPQIISQSGFDTSTNQHYCLNKHY